jgi:hypothetical protein
MKAALVIMLIALGITQEVSAKDEHIATRPPVAVAGGSCTEGTITATAEGPLYCEKGVWTLFKPATPDDGLQAIYEAQARELATLRAERDFELDQVMRRSQQLLIASILLFAAAVVVLIATMVRLRRSCRTAG